MTAEAWALLPVLVVAAVHLAATRFRGAVGRHERAVVSAAGGISAAYVFLHLLPEVAAGAGAFRERIDADVAPVPLQELGVFLVALLGFTLFYLAERFAARTGSPRHGSSATEASTPAFAVHVAAFALYNVAVASTLPERVESGAVGAAVFTVAIAVHVLVVDRGLAEHYPRRYRVVGRYVLSAALLAGWLVGAVLVHPHGLTTSAMTALVAGSVLLTVFQEELPHAGSSRIGWFLAGLGSYSALLVALTLLEGPRAGG